LRSMAERAGVKFDRRSCGITARGSAELPLMTADDPNGLQRLVAAQDAGGTYEQAAADLRRA
jgi:hypothetical protein